MIKGLINEDLNRSLSLLVGMGFRANRLLDRQMSILSTKFTMNNTEKILHERLSHKFPLLSDEISSYQASRNNLTIYPDTPLDDSDYSSPIDLFTKFYDFMVEFEESIKEVIQEAESLNDIMTSEFLRGFLLKIGKYTEQSIILCDKAEMYKDNWMAFDKDISNFVFV